MFPFSHDDGYEKARSLLDKYEKSRSLPVFHEAPDEAWTLVCRDDIVLDRDKSKYSKGGFSIMHKGYSKTHRSTVAIKTIKFDGQGHCRDQCLLEIGSLARREACPHVVRILGGFFSTGNEFVGGSLHRQLHLVLDFMDLGSIADLMERIVRKGEVGVPSDMLSCITQQMTMGLEFLHSQQILHGSVAPQNVLHNTAGVVKLSETQLSAAAELAMHRCHTSITHVYLSPERCLGDPFSYACDVWACGLVVYELACGQYPFRMDNFPVFFEDLCDNPEPRLRKADFPANLCEFVASCLSRDVPKRSDSVALNCHPFVADAGHDSQVYTALIEWMPADKAVQITCVDLGGTKRLQVRLSENDDITTLESYFREHLPGYRRLFGHDGIDVPGNRLIRNYRPLLTIQMCNAALATYFKGLRD
mmetsp:Transcript_71269/g.112904  ORF Transcript_71269/g.112904 Transcript_71269/m.112904 type:complete len:418 (+) Transcript_71269:55-1308(+)